MERERERERERDSETARASERASERKRASKREKDRERGGPVQVDLRRAEGRQGVSEVGPGPGSERGLSEAIEVIISL